MSEVLQVSDSGLDSGIDSGVAERVSDSGVEGVLGSGGTDWDSSSSRRIAVVDVGSNSTRMEVLELTTDYDLRVLSEVNRLLRLQSRMTADGRLSEGAVSDLTRVLRDFAVVASASGVDEVRAVATSSLRSASNGSEVLMRLRSDTGIDVEVISGDDEARYGFLGAVFSLPVSDGVLVDIGGGSVEISFFAGRRLQDVFTLDLGALRVSNDFLREDPPSDREIRSLRKHVRRQLESSKMPPLEDGWSLVGTGGTIRNLAKMDRAIRPNVFSRLHGTVVKYGRLKRIVSGLRGLERVNRAYVSGLNPDRADSILGGAIVMQEIGRFFGRRALMVSGRGLREGLALSRVIGSLPEIEDVRSRSIYALGRRFDTWDRLRADRRAALASRMSVLLRDEVGSEMCGLIVHAAREIDTGRSIYYYDRYRHAANIMEQGELGGFSHRDVALMSASIRFNGNDFSIARYRPHLGRSDLAVVRRAAVLLRVADEMERRLDASRFSKIAIEDKGSEFVVSAPELCSWDPGRLANRFRRAFRREFLVKGE